MNENDLKNIKMEAIDEYKNSQTCNAIEFAKELNKIVIESMKTNNKSHISTYLQIEIHNLMDP